MSITAIPPFRERFTLLSRRAALICSTFFRDILFTSLCDDGGQPILHIPASSVDTELLLDMMHGKTTTANVDVKQWARLAELAKQFGCDLLLERVIIPDLKAVLSKHPYHVFCSASRIQDVDLAVTAIKALKHDYTLNPTPVVTDCGKRHSTYSSALSKLTQEQWQGCHGDYFFALVKAIAEYEEEGIEGAYAWGTVAANFRNHLPKVSRREQASGYVAHVQYVPTTQAPLATQRPLNN